MPGTSSIRKAIAGRFGDELRFFRGWLDRPGAVGAILPTSSIAARRMASVADPRSDLPVLELGPGTGVITRALLERGVPPARLYSVEYSADFVEHLRRAFPGVKVVHGSAFDLDAALGELKGQKFDCVISAVPLLNVPSRQRVDYLEDLLERIPAGRPVVQITYGALSPVPPRRGSYTLERFDFVMRNIPPAHLWIYRRGRPG